jgi:hypothetical protein
MKNVIISIFAFSPLYRFPASVAVSTTMEDDNVLNVLQDTLDIPIAKVKDIQ